jgi:hypothetical protein
VPSSEADIGRGLGRTKTMVHDDLARAGRGGIGWRRPHDLGDKVEGRLAVRPQASRARCSRTGPRYTVS